MIGNNVTMVILRLFARLPRKKQREILDWKEDLPPRGWIIYFACMKEPKSLHQLSKELGYSGFSALYHQYKGVALIDWMLMKGYMKIHSKKGREIFFLSV